MADQATVARPYARAAFEHAHAARELAVWGDYLAGASAAVADPQVKPLIGNPHVARSAVAQLLIEVAGAERHAAFANFLQLLAENRRLEFLPAITAQYAALRAAVENTIEVKVTAAKPLSDEQARKLTDALAGRLSRTVSLQIELDPALIGGAVVQAGDFVIDGSLRGRIERLNNIMAGS